MSSEDNKQYECNKCTKTFKSKHSVKDHILAKHSNEKKYVCSICEKSFSYKQSFNRHINMHNLDTAVYPCSECGYSSDMKCSLTRHIKSVHQKENNSHLNVSCVFCNQTLPKSKLTSHYMYCHHTEIIYEYLKFDSLDAFYAWKYEIEDRDISRFIKSRVTYISPKSGFKHLFFKCHRYGKYKPKGKMIRKLKTMGSNKISFDCPARMDVKVEGNDVRVLYIKTHVGHELETERLFLRKNDIKFLTEQVKKPNNNYYDILSVVKTSNSSNRLNHLTIRDLTNIKVRIKSIARKSNTIKMTKNGNKLSKLMEINNGFREDIVALNDVKNNNKSTHVLSSENENMKAQIDKQDLIYVNNSSLVTDQTDMKISFINEVDPIYDLRTELQIIGSNEQIPTFESNCENNNKSTNVLSSENEKMEAQIDKQDLIYVNNTSLVTDQTDMETSFINEVDPIYDLRAELQIIGSDEQIPTFEYNCEILESSQVINYALEHTNIENQKINLLKNMKLIVDHIAFNEECTIVSQGLVNILNTINERRNGIHQEIFNGDVDDIMILDRNILKK